MPFNDGFINTLLDFLQSARLRCNWKKYDHDTLSSKNHSPDWEGEIMRDSRPWDLASASWY